MTVRNTYVSRRLLTALMTAVLIMSVFVSLAYVIEEADHECSGNDCPVCRTLSICRRSIHGTITVISAAAVLIITVHIVLCSCSICIAENSGFSLITQKTRMNN
ncbi:MAG: hypothetical protein IJG49_00630 [Erysipelotrichaceae bacterium]|nr:hypothetical protein [Erysipelotrichaceae bacterium]